MNAALPLARLTRARTAFRNTLLVSTAVLAAAVAVLFYLPAKKPNDRTLAFAPEEPGASSPSSEQEAVQKWLERQRAGRVSEVEKNVDALARLRGQQGAHESMELKAATSMDLPPETPMDREIRRLAPPQEANSPSEAVATTTAVTAAAALLTSTVSLFGFFTTSYLAWRKEKREQRQADIDIQQKQLEIARAQNEQHPVLKRRQPTSR